MFSHAVPVNASTEILVTLPGMVTLLRPEQYWKAPPLMSVIPLSIVNTLSVVQLKKAHSPILLTLPGITTLLKYEQPLNASVPILSTLFGIETLVRPEFLKA